MRRLLAGAVLAAVLIVPSVAAARGRYSAEIRRTEGGMPHIKARDYGSLGFGYELRGDERLPMSGCPDDEGCFNILTSKRDAQGVYEPYTGASFVMVAELTDRGPRGRAILRYSQSENPSSPHYADQTRLYAQERFLPLRFTEREIRRDPDYARTRVSGRR
jgi:acyl-homoserine lactone acylase PvdQ